jgi:RNA polymerase sigma factor (sigma-70 family)
MKKPYFVLVLLTDSAYTEEALVEGLLRHDEQAYHFLYDNYSKALFVVIFQVVSHNAIAEDVLQEVFIKVWQNIGQYDPRKGRLYTWMLSIARNQAVDKVRSREFNNQSKTVELTTSVNNLSDGRMAMEDSGLKKTLTQLPEENRKLLELAYYQGYTQEEIATMLGLPLGTVKTRIRSTILKLRKFLSIFILLWI